MHKPDNQVNGTMMQFFHWHFPNDGSLWNLLSEKAEEIRLDGYDALWLPPAYKGAKGTESEGYDCYDHYDLGEFEQKNTIRTKYGTREQYLAAIEKARKAGLSILADVVINHKAGADECERFRVKKMHPENREEALSTSYEIDGWTRFTFPGRNKKYSDFVWWWPCFTGVDYDQKHKEEGIFSIQSEYGTGWQDLVSEENGNFDYLIFCDIEYRNPAVREEMKRWIVWYLETTGVNGLRLDALKHINMAFINEWLDCVFAYTASQNRDLFIVGEYWRHEPQSLEDYLNATGNRISLFDSALHYTFYEASQKGSDFDLCTIFDNSLVKRRPEAAVTFVDNHDTVPFQSLESTVEAWFKPIAYALILLRAEGYPCVFYADLYGTEFTEHKDDQQHHVRLDPVYHLRELVLARKRWAWGPQRDYFDDPNILAWVREGNEQHPGSGCAVTLSNGSGGMRRLELGTRHAGATFMDLLQNCPDQVQLDEQGTGDFPVPAGAVSVWINTGQLSN